MTGNPETRKSETGNQNRNRNRIPVSWSGNRNPQIKENKFFEFIDFAGKNKRPRKKTLKLNLFWNKKFPSVEIRATVALNFCRK